MLPAPLHINHEWPLYHSSHAKQFSPPVNDQSTELATFEYEKNIFPHNLNNFVRRFCKKNCFPYANNDTTTNKAK